MSQRMKIMHVEETFGEMVELSWSQVKRLADGIEPLVVNAGKHGKSNQNHAAETFSVPRDVISKILRRPAALRVRRAWLDALGKGLGIDTSGGKG